MTEIHTYRCDVCGKDFDDEDDCRKPSKGMRAISSLYAALLCCAMVGSSLN